MRTLPQRRRVARFPIDRRRPRPERSLRRRFLTDVVRGALLIVVLNLFVVQISVVRGHSMQPSLLDGDRLLVDRVTCHVLGVDRFDVVVLRSPIDARVDYVKRVVGLPGDRVRMRDGHVFVNGERLDEDFLHVPDHASMRALTVPVDELFVLGDNRPISCDSREFGLIDVASLRGTVRARFWPPSRFGLFF